MIGTFIAGKFRRPTGVVGRIVGYMMARGNAYEADVEYGSYDSAGVHLVAEATYGDFQPFTGTRFFGVDETSLIKQGNGPLPDSKTGSPVQ